MGNRRFQREEHWRQELAQEAARIMAEGGIEDFELAKRKARARLHVPSGVPAPRNQDIEAALIEYRSLFGGPERDASLRHLRRVAIDAMEAFVQFKPRLVGPVLSGSADDCATVTLHLFADVAEDVAFFLIDRGMPFRDTERRLRMSTGGVERLPGYAFVAEDVPIELLVFSGRSQRHAPLSPVDGRPMRRASLAEVRALVQQGDVRVPEPGE